MKETIMGLWKLNIDGTLDKLRPFTRWIQNCPNSIQNFFHDMSDRKIVGLILLINLIIVVAYLIAHLSRKRRKKGALLSLFMLSMPIVGPMYLLSAELLQALQKPFGDRDVDMKELSFDQSRIRQITAADEEKDRNVVPVEEALIISDRSDKRETFLQMIKEDDVESLHVVRTAVEDRDPEIAHYAASYLTDMFTRVKEKEASLHKTFEDEPTPQTCGTYARYLRDLLAKNLFEGMEQRRYLERLDDAYLWLLEHSPQNCSIGDMTALARLWLDQNNTEKAGQWIERIRPRCYEDLDAFKVCAIYYYRCGDRDALMDLLQRVRGCALELDSEALEWIRFFE